MRANRYKVSKEQMKAIEKALALIEEKLMPLLDEIIE